jgi:hypothetical protein
LLACLHFINAVIGAIRIDEMLSNSSMPPEHRRCLRANTPLERLMRDFYT